MHFFFVCNVDLKMLVEDFQKSSEFKNIAVEKSPDFSSSLDYSIDSVVPLNKAGFIEGI